MEAWLEFGKGPLFRFALVILVLGLLRSLALTTIGIQVALHRAGNRVLPWKDLLRTTFLWLVPLNRLWRKRPVYSTISFLWHIGLILVPLFLAAHVALFWNRSIGIKWWPRLPEGIADVLALATVILGVLLFLGRVLTRESRFISRFQDIAWVPLLSLTFLTGWLCATIEMRAVTYQASMLIHVWSADLILMLIPFTKVAHCVLLPFSQLVSAAGWKFPKGSGDRVATTLGKEGMPV